MLEDIMDFEKMLILRKSNIFKQPENLEYVLGIKFY